MNKTKTFYQFLTSGSGLAILVAVLFFVVLSLMLYMLADWLEGLSQGWKSLAGPIRNTGSLLLTVGGIQFLLRTKIWKDAIHSISEHLQLKEATIESGLVQYWKFDAIPWEQLFSETKEVTIVAISARPLLIERLSLLRSFLQREDTVLKLVLADFREPGLMSRFDAEFGEPPGTRSRKLRETLGELLKAFGAQTTTRIRLHLSASRIPYSVYRFDDRILFVPYIAEPTRDSGRIPALLFRGGGVTSQYLEPDLRYLLGRGEISTSDAQTYLQ